MNYAYGGRRSPIITPPIPPPSYIIDADFSAMVPGPVSAAAFLAATGLTFTRSTISTVQVSPVLLDATGGVNDAMIGSLLGTSNTVGLVIQPPTYNRIALARDWTGTGWVGASGTSRVAGVGPDGVLGTINQINLSAGQFGNYVDENAMVTGDPKTSSAWLRSVNQAVDGSQQMVNTNNGSTGVVANAVGSNLWARFMVIDSTGALRYYAPADSRDYTASGGQAAIARNVYGDYNTITNGAHRVEAIDTGPAYATPSRATDVVTYPSLLGLVRTGVDQMDFEFTFVAMCASNTPIWWASTAINAAAQGHFYFWYADVQNYGRIDIATGRLEIRVNNIFGDADPMTWATNDQIVLRVILGTVATANYSVNGAPAVDLNYTPLSTQHPNAQPASLVRIGGQIVANYVTTVSNTMLAWINRFRVAA